MDLQTQILKFLIDMNKRMDGLHIEETTEYDHPRRLLIKFEAKISCIYANAGMFSPSDAFYKVLDELAQKHFGVGVEGFGFNNTKTVFWIYEEKINY